MVSSRYTAPLAPALAEGWSLERMTPPSRLHGANGLRTGPDGRVYVAQVVGSQISAIDLNSGEIETISAMGSDIVGPDDLAFDDDGNLYVTEFTEGRVSVRQPNGATSVVRDDIPGANPITFHQGRLFVSECRPGARILELDRHGGSPRVLLDNVPMVNAMEVGPDGKLYFPVMGANEIWRIDLAGGAAEKVAGDLGVPDALKFDPSGHIVSTQVATGQVLRIDARTGNRTVLAEIAPGLDNLTFVGNRLFVSSISGQITEICADGRLHPLTPDGLHWPLGLVMTGGGTLFVADGAYLYRLHDGGRLEVVGMLMSEGFPGDCRGVAVSGKDELVVTTGSGTVARYWPDERRSETLATGFDRLYGIAVAPTGAVVVAEAGRGRVVGVKAGAVQEIASDLREPMGVAVAADGACFVSEAAAGRVTKLANGRKETLIDGLSQPQGLVLQQDRLFVLDALTKELIACDISSGERRTIATNLPVGAPPGVIPKALRAIPPHAGPMGPFAGLASGTDGTLYVSADAEGSVLALKRV